MYVRGVMLYIPRLFSCRLYDQDYMELVCENGQILAKSRRPKNNDYFQNQRTQSLLDLYHEGFKKIIKNLGDSQVVPVSESQQPQQDEENDEQTNNNNNKKEKIKSSKIEFDQRDVSKSNKRFESSSTLIDDSLKGSKNVDEVITAPPDEQSAAVGRSADLYFASSSMFSRGTARDLSCSSLKRSKYGDIEEEESTYLSNVREINYLVHINFLS